jgi:hypothetical protein
MDIHGDDGSVMQMSKLLNYIDGCATDLGDGIVAAGAVALALILTLWLAGCARLPQITADDAQNAGALATAVGDDVGEACWPLLATSGKAIATSSNPVGVLTALEQKRALQVALQNTVCQPVWTGVLTELLKATPAAPFIP